MIRFSTCFVALGVLVALSVSVAEGKGDRNLACFRRSFGIARRSIERQSETTVDCEAEESEPEARFALQYGHEQTFLRRSESSYLLRDQRMESNSKIVPASVVQRKPTFLHDSLLEV